MLRSSPQPQSLRFSNLHILVLPMHTIRTGSQRSTIIYSMLVCLTTGVSRAPRAFAQVPDMTSPASTPIGQTARQPNAATPKLVLAIGHSGGVSAIVYAPDGKSFLTSSNDKTIKQWNAQTGSLMRILSDDTWIRSLAFDPNGKTIAGADDRCIPVTQELQITGQ
jgi:WD40 repeat protein